MKKKIGIVIGLLTVVMAVLVLLCRNPIVTGDMEIPPKLYGCRKRSGERFIFQAAATGTDSGSDKQLFGERSVLYNILFPIGNSWDELQWRRWI